MNGLLVTYLVLLFASAGVFHHSGIKIPYFAFFGHDSGRRCKEAPMNMLVAMGIAAALCIGIGVYPEPLYRMLPYPVDYAPYTGSHVLTQLQLLMFSALAFAVLMYTRVYPPELRSANLDADWFYRRLLPRLLSLLDDRLGRSRREGERLLAAFLAWLTEWAKLLHGPRGPLGRTWGSGAMGMGVMLMLLAFLLSYYLV
jgi:multicomponent Na+:H+ antiporter subunit D